MHDEIRDLDAQIAEATGRLNALGDCEAAVKTSEGALTAFLFETVLGAGGDDEARRRLADAVLSARESATAARLLQGERNRLIAKRGQLTGGLRELERQAIAAEAERLGRIYRESERTAVLAREGLQALVNGVRTITNRLEARSEMGQPGFAPGEQLALGELRESIAAAMNRGETAAESERAVALIRSESRTYGERVFAWATSLGASPVTFPKLPEA